MSKDKESDEIIVDITVEEDADLDVEVLHSLNDKIQNTIDLVVNHYLSQDIRLEIVNILLSIASQVSIDIGIDEDEFSGMADYFYKVNETLDDEEEVDLSKLN